VIDFTKMGERITKGVLATFIIISVVAVIIILFLTRAKQESWDISEKIICKQSVELQAQQKQYLTIKGEHLTDTFGNPVDLKCYTHYETIKDKDDDVIKRKIANHMFHCWDQYGRGEIEIFDTTDNNYCVICSSLESTKKKQVSDFTKFLIEEKPASVSEKTYMQYFMDVTTKDNIVLQETENSDLKNLDKIELTEPLAVIFYMGKEAYPDSFLVDASKAKATVVGTSVGAVAGTLTGVIAGTAIVVGVLECATVIGCVKGVGMIALGTGLLGGGIGARTGYFVGSDSSAQWESRIILWNYNDIDKLDCSYLEGKSTPLKPYQMNKYK